jgi:Fe2+ transport system protein B
MCRFKSASHSSNQWGLLSAFFNLQSLSVWEGKETQCHQLNLIGAVWGRRETKAMKIKEEVNIELELSSCNVSAWQREMAKSKARESKKAKKERESKEREREKAKRERERERERLVQAVAVRREREGEQSERHTGRSLVCDVTVWLLLLLLLLLLLFVRCETRHQQVRLWRSQFACRPAAHKTMPHSLRFRSMPQTHAPHAPV